MKQVKINNHISSISEDQLVAAINNRKVISFQSIDKMSDKLIISIAQTLNSSSHLVSLSINFVSPECLFALCKNLETNNTLTFLKLSFINEMGNPQVPINICKLMKENSTLTSFALTYCERNDKFVSELAKVLKFNTSLKRLDLSHCMLNSYDAIALSEILEVNSTLLSLTLKENRIKGLGTFALCSSLKRNSSLTMLNLYSNDIEESGIKAISEVIIINPSLKSLDISFSPMYDEVLIQLFCNSFKANKTITFLSLISCHISDTGISALARVLENNDSLLFLDLTYNNITLKGVIPFILSLRASPTPKCIKVYKNKFSEDEISPTMEIIRDNPNLKYIDIQYSETETTTSKVLGAIDSTE